jgi:hypothetical protein
MWDLKRNRDSMPQDIKFEVKCIDIASNNRNTFSNIERTFINGEYPDLSALNEFFNYGNRIIISKRKAKKILENLRTESAKHDSIYKIYLGENYNEFQIQIEAGLIYLNGSSIRTSNGMESREFFLYNNSKRLIEKNSDCIFFGQFGRAHVAISKQERWLHLVNWESFAARLNTYSESPAKGKVCSALIFYQKDDKKNDDYESTIKSVDIPFFMKYATTPVTIFKLDAPQTPFKEMSEKFQYLIINKY